MKIRDDSNLHLLNVWWGLGYMYTMLDTAIEIQQVPEHRATREQFYAGRQYARRLPRENLTDADA